MTAQDITVVILIERSGGYWFAAFSTAEAVGMVIVVSISCALAHNALVTHGADLGKVLQVALLTVRLVIVRDKRHPRQLFATADADEALGVVRLILVLHTMSANRLFASCTSFRTLAIVALPTYRIPLVPHKRLVHQRQIAHQTIEAFVVPEFVVFA